MERDYNLRNRVERERLKNIVASIDDAGLAMTTDNGWTVGVALAHLAFWERRGLQSLEQWQRDGSVPPAPAGGADALNSEELAAWQSRSPREAAEDAVQVMEQKDRLVAELSSEAVAAILAIGRPRLDASGHRKEHIDQIEVALSGSTKA